MDDFIIELEWSEDYTLMQRMCRDIFNICPSLVTNQPRTDYFTKHFERNDAFYRARMWTKVRIGQIMHLPEYNEWQRLIPKFHLVSDVMFFVTCPEITPIFVPHRHPAPSPDWHAGALMLPLIGTDEQSITKYAHWHNPEDNRYIDSYNYIKGRPELSEIPDEEVAVEYCLHEKPAIFNRHQFHQVVNPTDHWRVVAHIPYDTESWDDCKKFALIK